MFGGYDGGYEGGWDPAPFLENPQFPTQTYKSKSGKDYMDFKAWADGLDQAKRDLLLRKNVYLSAKMMKYHPLMTKELRKTYSLLAAAAMRAMTPETKFEVKRRFNETNTAIKALRAEQKLAKAKYGPVAKRGLYGKIDFWNRLIDLPIDSEDAPLLLTGYEPGVLRDNPEYKPSGTLGDAVNYQAYKDALAERREKMRQKMLLLSDSEREWYRQRARFWSKGRKRAREAIKAYKDQLAASVDPITLAKFNPEKTLGEMYEDAFNAEINSDRDFYKDKDLRTDIVKEMAEAEHVPWFKQAYCKFAKGKRFADEIPEEKSTNLLPSLQGISIISSQTFTMKQLEIQTDFSLRR